MKKILLKNLFYIFIFAIFATFSSAYSNEIQPINNHKATITNVKTYDCHFDNVKMPLGEKFDFEISEDFAKIIQREQKRIWRKCKEESRRRFEWLQFFLKIRVVLSWKKIANRLT